MYSAMATEASLPEAMTMHLIRVSTVCFSPSSKNTWDPPMDLARALVTTSSSREIFPDSRASKIRIRVMILVMLAGLLCPSASFSQITWPVDASMRMALGAATSGPPSPSFRSDCAAAAGNAALIRTVSAVSTAAIRLIASPLFFLYYQYRPPSSKKCKKYFASACDNPPGFMLY